MIDGARKRGRKPIMESQKAPVGTCGHLGVAKPERTNENIQFIYILSQLELLDTPTHTPPPAAAAVESDESHLSPNQQQQQPTETTKWY